VLSSLSCFSPSCFTCSAEVILTDEEASEIQSAIQESRQELSSVKAQLNDVKNDYNEQRTSYEEQLQEAEERQERLEKAVTVTGTSSVIFAVLMIVFIIL
jgi:uncharacterized membrane protein